MSDVEDAADDSAAAVDVALAAELTIVAIEGSDAGEHSGLAVAQRAEFGQKREDGEGTDAANAGEFPKIAATALVRASRSSRNWNQLLALRHTELVATLRASA